MARHRLRVKDGRLLCPHRGDIDVDWCVSCSILKSIGPGSRDSFVICGERESWLDGLADVALAEGGVVLTPFSD
jgi:hypothetical protein